MTIWLLLLVVLVIVLLATVPVWPYSRGWGVSPVSIVLSLILIVLLLWALGLIELRGVEDAIDEESTRHLWQYRRL